MDPLRVPQGEFSLARYPVRKGETLRAWDAADELLLRWVADDQPAAGASILIVNDAFGALATALASRRPVAVSDSYLSRRATLANLERNGIDHGLVTLLAGFDEPAALVDLVLIKVPKSLSLLEDELHRLRPFLAENATIVSAGMVKHIHTSTLDLLESILGPTHTSLAKKKARLIYVTPAPAVEAPANPWPMTYTLEPGGEIITGHAGIFSPKRLDIGTRMFLATLAEQLPSRLSGTASTTSRSNDLTEATARGPRIIDLGCGSGVVGLAAAQRYPDAEVTFIDESYRAVAAAEATFRANLGRDRVARFVAGDILKDLADDIAIEPGSVDLVLNNPPFHDDHAIGDDTAWQMFREAHAVLRPGGQLWIVGNRHLAYHTKVKRLFGHCDNVAANAKFVVLRAIRRK